MQAQTVYMWARSHGSPDEEEEFNMKKKYTFYLPKLNVNCFKLFNGGKVTNFVSCCIAVDVSHHTMIWELYVMHVESP